eukprot:Gb_10572 [translate_table: standard]
MDPSKEQVSPPRTLAEFEAERKNIFPVVSGPTEFPTITPEILSKIIKGELDFDAKSYTIVDCRHFFEYAGGHIRGAINIDDPDDMEEYYEENVKNGKSIAIIFHCEFSSSRAPKMLHYVRNEDRKKHFRTYPELDYPHLYLLGGGYKAFYEQFSDLCEPKGYVKMTDTRFAKDLSVAKRKMTASWNARQNGI